MKMNDLQLESEAMQISIYCHVICQILNLHKQIDYVKLIFIAYIVKTKKNLIGILYNNRNSIDLTDKMVSLLIGDYKNFCNSINYIIKAIHLLINNKNIELENNMIFYKKINGYEQEIYEKDSFLYKSIEEINKLEDYQFLKEIIQNV